MKRNFCELDLTNVEVVQQSGHLLDNFQREMLQQAFSPYKLRDPAFTSPYYEAAGLIINAQPWFAQRYCFCGMRGANQRRHWCNQWKYCPRCAYSKGRKLLHKFGHLYVGHNWQHLTMSFDGAVNFHEHRHLCDALWDVLYQEYLKVERDWYITGAIYAEELKILSFLPAACMPHAHVLINAEEVGEAQVEDLSAAIDARLAAHDELQELGLSANTQVKRLEQPEHLENALTYLTKPHKLREPYQSALVDHAPIAINSAARDVIFGLGGIGVGRKRIRYRGTMSPNSRQYIGNKAPAGSRIIVPRAPRIIAPRQWQPEEISLAE